jgi:hypothetical protein
MPFDSFPARMAFRAAAAMGIYYFQSLRSGLPLTVIIIGPRVIPMGISHGPNTAFPNLLLRCSATDAA